MTFASFFLIVLPGVGMLLLFIALALWAATRARAAALDAQVARVRLEEVRAGEQAIDLVNRIYTEASCIPILEHQFEAIGLMPRMQRLLDSKPVRRQIGERS